MIFYCKICDERIVHDADVVATVLAKYVGLKSKIAYAISKPTDCLGVVHKECFKRDIDE